MRRCCSLRFGPSLLLGLFLTASPAFADPKPPAPDPSSDAAASDGSSAPPEDMSAEALADEGRRLAAENRLAEARPYLLQAVEKGNDAYQVLGNLGIVEHELELWLEARKHLGLALTRYPADGPEQGREALQARITRVDAELVTLEMDVSPASACVTIDGAAPVCGPFDAPLHALPRPKLRIEAEGHRPVTRTLAAAAGERVTLGLALTPIAPEAPPPPPLEADDDEPLLSPGGYVSVALATTGLLMLTTAGGFQYYADAEAEQADELLTSLRTSAGNAAPCQTPSASCEGIASRLRRHDDFSNASVGLFLSGASLVVGATVIGVLTAPGDDEESATAPTPVSVQPWVGRSTAGLVVGGAW